jgi:hypothetical protein
MAGKTYKKVTQSLGKRLNFLEIFGIFWVLPRSWMLDAGYLKKDCHGLRPRNDRRRKELSIDDLIDSSAALGMTTGFLRSQE